MKNLHVRDEKARLQATGYRLQVFSTEEDNKKVKKDLFGLEQL